jgi:hypothetical protein
MKESLAMFLKTNGGKMSVLASLAMLMKIKEKVLFGGQGPDSS